MSVSIKNKTSRSDSVISSSSKKREEIVNDKIKTKMSKVVDVDKTKLRELEEELKKLKEDNRTKNETIISLKMEKSEALATVTNFNTLQTMKADTDKANAFFKMIMRDNLINYKEVHTPNYMDSEEMSQVVKVKKSLLKDNSSNRYECKCSACVVLFNESTKGNYVKMRKMVKHVEISRGVIMGLSYDSTKFNYENHAMTDNKKNINLIYKGFDQSKIGITFTVSKSSNLKMEDLDIGANRTMSIGVDNMKVSYASFMIVEAMRNLISMSIEENSRSFSKVTVEHGVNDCFSSVMKELIPIYSEKETFTKFMINELTEEEEMVLLTESWNKIVYIKKSTDKDTKNHISLEPFENSQEIMVMLLVTPMLRDVMFFANEEDTTNLIDDSMENWSAEMVEAFVDEMGNNNDTSSDSGEGMMMPKLNMHRQGDMKFKATWDVSKIVKYHENLPVSDFKKSMMVEFGFDQADVEHFSNSKIFNLIPDNSPMALQNLVLYYITYNEFRALAYFSKSIKTFLKLITMTDFKQLYLMMKSIPFNILEVYYENNKDVVVSELKDNFEIYNDFMASMDKMKDLNNNVMLDLYEDFRKKVKNYLIMDKMASYLDCQKLDNREYYMCLVDRTHEFDDFENIRFKMLKNPILFDNFEKSLENVDGLTRSYKFYDSSVSMERMLNRNRMALLMEELKFEAYDENM